MSHTTPFSHNDFLLARGTSNNPPAPSHHSNDMGNDARLLFVFIDLFCFSNEHEKFLSALFPHLFLYMFYGKHQTAIHCQNSAWRLKLILLVNDNKHCKKMLGCFILQYVWVKYRQIQPLV